MEKRKQHKPRPNIIKYQGKRRVPYNYGVRMSLRLDRLDERTKEGKTARLLYQVLWDYAGEPNAPMLMLIDTIVFKKLQMILCESKHTSTPLDKLPAMYLSLSNSLRQDLKLFAELAQQPSPPDLDDYLKEAYDKTGK